MSRKEEIKKLITSLIALNKSYTRKVESAQKLTIQKNKIIQAVLDKIT
jgi:hypothetical protein